MKKITLLTAILIMVFGVSMAMAGTTALITHDNTELYTQFDNPDDQNVKTTQKVKDKKKSEAKKETKAVESEAKKCGADCTKPCCKEAKKCAADCTKPCCTKTENKAVKKVDSPALKSQATSGKKSCCGK